MRTRVRGACRIECTFSLHHMDRLEYRPILTSNGKTRLRVSRRALPMTVNCSTSSSSGVGSRYRRYLHIHTNTCIYDHIRHIYLHIHSNTCIYKHIPVQPLVDCYDNCREWIRNAIARPGSCMSVVFGNFGVSQAIQHVWENQHKLLHIRSINDGRLLLALLLGVVRVSKRETMDWCVKPMSVVCLEYRLLLRLCRRAVSFCIMLFRGTPRSTSSLWMVLTMALLICIETP